MNWKKYQDRYKKHFLGNLQTFQKMMKICLFILTINSTICYFKSRDIIMYVLRHLSQQDLILTDLSDGFLILINVSFFCGLFLTIPIFLILLYRFICPIFETKDRIFFGFILCLSSILFIAGVFFLNQFLLPDAIKFFLNYSHQIPYTSVKINLKEYLQSLFFYSFSFGVLFQFPVPMIVMIRYKILKCRQLLFFRKFFIVIAFIISGVITPPDVLSQVICSFGMIVMYEMLILISKYYELRK